MQYQQVIEFITSQLHNNQFLTGGFVLGLMAAVMHQCRALPGRIWTWIKCRFIIEVDVQDRDEAFQWVNKWLSLHPYGQNRARLLTVKTERPDGGPGYVCRSDQGHGQPKIIFSPAVGHHWFFYKGRLVMLERESKDNAGNGSPQLSLGIRESFTIRMFTRDRGIIMQLLEEARELVHPKGEKRLSIMSVKYGDWRTAIKCRPRAVESVVLRAGLMEELIKDVQEFLGREKWYVDRGIPYRRGYLLKGPPGSGKSSAVMALASHFGLDIAILSLSGGGMSDNELRDLLSDVPDNTLVLIEDIDCVFNQREPGEDKDSKVTFSGLLNAIDGVAAGEGRILFMTTNFPEKLDSALIRPGRADMRVDIGPPDAGQVSRMFERFYPESTPTQNLRFVEATPLDKTSMAAIQGHLTKYCNDPEQAIRNADECEIKAEVGTAA